MKNIVTAMATFTLILFASCEDGCTNENSYNFDNSATRDDGSCKSLLGCTGFNDGMDNSGTFGNTFYNSTNDILFSNEIASQSNFWNGITARVSVWYEPYGTMNAVSTSQGNIFFGYNLFYHVVNSYSANDYAVDGILAHEWGHQIQYQLNYITPSNYLTELEADAFSGFYIAAGKQFDEQQLYSYYHNTFSSGSNNYNSPDFHGTPQQRYDAVRLGMDYGIAMLNGTSFTYQQLHSRIVSDIQSMIMYQRKGEEVADKSTTIVPSSKRLEYPTGKASGVISF